MSDKLAPLDPMSALMPHPSGQANRLDIYVHVDITNTGGVPNLGEILSALQRIEAQGVKIMATLDQIIEKVTEQTTAIGSVKALIVGLREQLAGFLAGQLTPEVQAKVDQAFATAEANSAAIADALAENVPAEPPAGAAKRR